MSGFSLEIPALEATVGVLDTSLTEYATLRSGTSTSLEALTSDDAWSGNGRDAFKKNVQEWLGHFDTYYAQMEAMYNTLKDTVLPAAEALNKQTWL